MKQFRFQTGSIKSLKGGFIKVCEAKFRFQTGSIKSESPRIMLSVFVFRFQTGSIKSETTETQRLTPDTRFDSKLVRLKVRICSASLRGRQRFDSKLVRLKGDSLAWD